MRPPGGFFRSQSSAWPTVWPAYSRATSVRRWRVIGAGPLLATVAGAALTATGVGITARVLSDLGRLQDPESQVVLGAAVIDDVIGLIILTVVHGLADGGEVTVGGVARVAGIAIGF